MNTKTSPKDFFLHLGATIALYVLAIALLNLSFTVIDRILPDKLSYYSNIREIVWPISMLIILGPLYYVLEWINKRDILKIPEKSEMWINKWRIYLTLFLTGATIVGSLIFLLNTYLSGEITSRFIFKALTVLVVSAIIFSYFILSRVPAVPMESGSSALVWRKILAWAGIVIILAAIISGFIVAGSPATLRALRFDQERVNGLSNIQYQIINYWQRKGELPTSTDALKDPLIGSVIPVDPDTKEPYEYAVKGQQAFELCANFSLPSEETREYLNMPYQSNENWKHGAGRQCYERTIDPSLYPVLQKSAPIREIPAVPKNL